MRSSRPRKARDQDDGGVGWRSSRPQKARAQDDRLKAHPPNPPQWGNL